MARRIRDSSSRSTQDNPRILGNDVVELLAQAGGLGASAFVNDKLLAAPIKSIVPGFNNASNLAGKVVDGFTTGVSAWAVGQLVRLFSKRYADDVLQGGLILAMGKVASGIIPGFSISAEFPSFTGLAQLGVNSGLPVLPAATSPTTARPTAQTGAIRMLAI